MQLSRFLLVPFLLCTASVSVANSFVQPRNSAIAAVKKRTSTNSPPPTSASDAMTLPSFPHRSLSSMVVFNNAPFAQSSAIFGGANLLGLIVSLLTGSHVHLDLIGTGVFAVVAVPTLLTSTIPRIQYSSAAMGIWATKLASFLFYRALQTGDDGRLESILATTSGTFGFWFISFLWGIVCSLPQTLGSTSSSLGNPYCTGIGLSMYTVGLLTETLADYQKWNFKKSNPGKFCNVGLWSISQHPNFFGNLLLWSGIFVLNAPALIESSSGNSAQKNTLWRHLWGSRRLFAAALSPLFMWTLFSGQANGTISNTVKLANAKYGADPAYQEYIKTVPKIIPNPLLWFGQN